MIGEGHRGVLRSLEMYFLNWIVDEIDVCFLPFSVPCIMYIL